MTDALVQRLRQRINELDLARRKAERISQADAARAWDLECQLEEAQRENVALLAEVRRLRQDLSVEGLEG